VVREPLHVTSSRCARNADIPVIIHYSVIVIPRVSSNNNILVDVPRIVECLARNRKRYALPIHLLERFPDMTALHRQ
jgi:hypothetical protein